MGGVGGVVEDYCNTIVCLFQDSLLHRMRYEFTTSQLLTTASYASLRIHPFRSNPGKNFFPAYGHFLGNHVFLQSAIR